MEKQTKTIEVNKFYFIHDDSFTGHPGLVVSKNDELNRYLVVRFDSDKFGVPSKRDNGLRHITELSHPISENIAKSYVRNRPMLCKRKDIGVVLDDLVINKSDLNIINEVSKRTPELSRSLRKRKKSKLK